MRHGVHAMVAATVAGVLLAGCSSSPSTEPSASHTRPTRSSPPTSPSTGGSSSPTSPTSSAPTTGPTTGSSPPVSTALLFSPKSAGRHSHTCFGVTGSDPVDYVYYPVMVKATEPVTIDSAAVTYADGVQVAGAWVAPAAATHGTGAVEGWPAPKILTQSTSVNWGQRVPAAGAALTPGGWYNVFLHLRVYPDALPLATDGVVLTFHDASGDQTVTWVDHLTFKTSC